MLKQIKFDSKYTTLVQLERMINDQTGRHVHLTQDHMQVSRLNSQKEMRKCFAQVLTDRKVDQLAYVQLTDKSNN